MELLKRGLIEIAKIFKFSGYYIDTEDYGAEVVEMALDDCADRLDMFAHHITVKEADIGKWNDDSPLNMCDCPLSECEKYFKKD